MLWRACRRWMIYRPCLEAHSLLVPFSRSCRLQLFSSSARRKSSSASATALHRRDAPIPAPHRPSRIRKDELKPPVPEQKNDGKRCERKQENNHIPTVPVPLLPDGLLLWLDEHFACEPPHKYVREHINQRQEWSQFLSNAESVCRTAEELAQTDMPQRALYLLQARHLIGLKLKQNLYERVVYRLAMAQRWRLVLSVIAAALSTTGKTTLRLLNWRGRALMSLQEYAKLDGLIAEFTNHGVKPQRRTFMFILRGHLRNHDLARAKATMQDMERAGFPITASTYTEIVPAYRGFGLDNFIQDRGHDVLSNNYSAKGTQKILNGLLQLHLDKHDIEGALKLLETFGHQPKASEIESASPVADGHAADGGKASLHASLEDHATYTILINHLSKHGPSSLDGILKRMRNFGGTPDIRVGASLIRMHYARGEEHKALVVLRDCCEGLELQVDVLTSLGFDPQDQDPSPFAPYMGRPTTELFNAVLHGAIQIRGLSTTILVLKLMKDARVKPNDKTLECFLWHLARERPIVTEDIVNTMRTLLSSDVKPTLGALNIIFKSIVHSAKRAKYQEGWNALGTYAQRAIESLKVSGSERQPHASEIGPEPTFDRHLCITDLQASVFRDVLKPIVRSLRRRRVLADRATFSLRMHYDSLTLYPIRAPEALARNLQIMRDRGLYPNVYHYAALMEAHCSAGNIRGAHEVLQDTIARNLVPQQKSRVILYTILISANARIGRPDLALSVFRELLKANIAPDVGSIDALVGAFFAVKAFRLARRVLLDLWPMVAPFPMELREASLQELITRLRDINARAEAPNPEIKKPTGLKKAELIKLSNDIVAEWNGVLEARDEDVQIDSSSDAASIRSNVYRSAGSANQTG